MSTILKLFLSGILLLFVSTSKGQGNVSLAVTREGDAGFAITKSNLAIYLSSEGKIISANSIKGNLNSEISSGVSHVSYDLHDRVSEIGGERISYNLQDRVSDIGGLRISYNLQDKVSNIGDIRISYNLQDKVSEIGSQRVSYNLDGKVSSF
jgi:hypothetical protein